jgi:hypothetical protein
LPEQKRAEGDRQEKKQQGEPEDFRGNCGFQGRESRGESGFICGLLTNVVRGLGRGLMEEIGVKFSKLSPAQSFFAKSHRSEGKEIGPDLSCFFSHCQKGSECLALGGLPRRNHFPGFRFA